MCLKALDDYSLVVTGVQNYIAAGQFRGASNCLMRLRCRVRVPFRPSWSRSTQTAWMV